MFVVVEGRVGALSVGVRRSGWRALLHDNPELPRELPVRRVEPESGEMVAKVAIVSRHLRWWGVTIWLKNKNKDCCDILL